MADFLRLIEDRNEQGNMIFIASEEWGTKIDVLSAGEKAARGAITFKVGKYNNLGIYVWQVTIKPGLN